MILTITLNPAIDISYPIETLQIDKTNRVEKELKSAGGKGLNVSRVLHLLKKEVLATGLIGGMLGKFIEKELDRQTIPHDFYETDQESRICIGILHDDGQQTELLEGGPTYSVVEEAGFLTHVTTLMKDPDVNLMTISGSLPKGLSSDIYNQIIMAATEQNIKVLLDCSGSTLLRAIQGDHQPYLIKPNETEIQEILPDVTLANEEQLMAALNRKEFKGIPWIIVSQGADGALAKVGTDFYRVSIPKIDVINPVGSGDATIAGLAASISEAQTVEECLKTAMTTGILNTLEQRTGYITLSDFDTYYQQVSVELLSP